LSLGSYPVCPVVKRACAAGEIYSACPNRTSDSQTVLGVAE
jgi:hypothetical protein